MSPCRTEKWTSYSDLADWCFLLPAPIHDVPKHKGISAFAVPHASERVGAASAEDDQRHHAVSSARSALTARWVSAANMIGEPGEGWKIVMMVVSHEREPGELGYVALLDRKVVKELTARAAYRAGAVRNGAGA